MPNMDGLTFVKQYRQRARPRPSSWSPPRRKTRVIEAIKAGVNNYVVKPFTPDVLSQRITETVGKGAGAAASPGIRGPGAGIATCRPPTTAEALCPTEIPSR